MHVKRGIETSEFWVTAVVNIVSAVIGILAVRGLVSAEEQELYLVLVKSIAAAVAPLVMAFTTRRYIQAREQVKTTNPQPLDANR